MRDIKYTKEVLETAIANSRSWREVCKYAGANQLTGTQSYLKRKAVAFNIDFSHFRHGAVWRGGNDYNVAEKPIEEYLVYGSSIKPQSLKNKLIMRVMKTNKCEMCGMTQWLNEDIPIEMHHINHDHADNRLDNLMMLCPNCHAIEQRRHRREFPGYVCERCGGKRSRKNKSGLCYKCSEFPEKINWPTDEELRDMVWAAPSVILARNLGVSDSAIYRRCKNKGIPKPPRGYWAKQNGNIK